MAPFQTAVTIADDNRDGQEVIEVQILPQVGIRILAINHEWYHQVTVLFF